MSPRHTGTQHGEGCLAVREVLNRVGDKWSVLIVALLKDGPLPMQDLARLIERDNSTVTTLADKLEKQRFVKRNVAEHDTRSHIISITPKGAQAASQIIAASRATVGEIFAGFSDSERTAFTELLQRVYKNMED